MEREKGMCENERGRERIGREKERKEEEKMKQTNK